MDFNMTKDDAMQIVGWFSTDIGQQFLEYLSILGQGNTAELLRADRDVDYFRAQGSAHQLRRVLDFLTHAERVVSGEIPASEADEGPGSSVSDSSDLGAASVDDGSGVGSEEGA